jgi:sulfhydrogenase subunit beta (sulfur reductase)
MPEVIVTKSDLPGFLRSIAKDRRLVAPVKDRMGTTFAEVDDPSVVCVGLGNTNLSPKGVIFPQSEVLLAFAGDEGQVSPIPKEEVLLFGVRPCDARAFSLLDKVFTWEGIDDPYYLHRREKTTVVALACNEPGSACFCTSVGGSPAGEAGADVLAFDLGDRLLLSTRTERGEALLEEVSTLTEKATEADKKKAKKLVAEAEKQLKPVSIHKDLAVLKQSFDAEIWEELGLKCLGCGACAYVCPTCHCFDITDETRRGSGRRVRSWDTCASSQFTLHGSGHNPRPAQSARYRQRILHKFLYCPENFGEAFCVGCGRCVIHCPAGLDLREVLEKLVSLAGRV